MTDEAQERTLFELRRRVGATVRAERTQQKLSQHDLAKRARLSRTSIAQIERGDQECGIARFVMLATALGMPAQDLLSDALKSATDSRSRDPFVTAVIGSLRR